eukprot:m.113797 g.113797  ORF g.113797 m.113797 type:complete len:737 (+) comp9429_c0_seq5:167-2377(+)
MRRTAPRAADCKWQSLRTWQRPLPSKFSCCCCCLKALFALAVLLTTVAVGAQCPDHAIVGTDASGTLLVCSDDQQEVYLGGGVSDGLAELEALNLRLRMQMWRPLANMQVLPVNDTVGFELIEVGSERLLVTVSGATRVGGVESHVFRFDVDAGEFDLSEPWQTFNTHAARDSTQFQINDEHYLAVASSRSDSTSSNTAWSYVYKLDVDTLKFDFANPVDRFSFDKAFCVQHFSINGNHFLAFGSLKNGSVASSHSYIFKFDFEAKSFLPDSPFMLIPVPSVAALDFFQIGTDHFLAVASSQAAESDLPSRSYVFKFGRVLGLGELQSVEADASRFIKHLAIDGHHYLVTLQNHEEDQAHSFHFPIYKFEPQSGLFDLDVPWQVIKTEGGRSIECFEFGQQYFLAVANFRSSETSALTSHIYKFDRASRRFNTVFPWASIATHDAWIWRSFNFGRKFLLALSAVQIELGSNQTGSAIFISDWIESPPPPRLGSELNPASSCLAIKKSHPDSASGVYFVQAGGLPRIKVYCDMNSFGGGWTLLYSTRDSTTSGDNSFLVGNISTAVIHTIVPTTANKRFANDLFRALDAPGNKYSEIMLSGFQNSSNTGPVTSDQFVKMYFSRTGHTAFRSDFSDFVARGQGRNVLDEDRCSTGSFFSTEKSSGLPIGCSWENHAWVAGYVTPGSCAWGAEVWNEIDTQGGHLLAPSSWVCCAEHHTEQSVRAGATGNNGIHHLWIR